MRFALCFSAAVLSALLLSCITGIAVTPLVSYNDQWRYHKGTNAPQSDWKTADDSALDSTWLAGQGGFGYGATAQETNNCGTILSDSRGSTAANYSTIYLRKAFPIAESPGPDTHLFLRMDFDDGYIAWLDGQYLTNRNVAGAPAEPSFSATASGGHECSTGNSSPQPAETYDLGVASNWLGMGTHTLAIIGMNDSKSGSSDFIVVADLFLDEVLPPPPVTNGMGGLIATDTILFATNGIYTVTNNLIVASNTTLTIEPGVTVRFRQGTGMTVNGRLIAEGDADKSITFTRHPGDTSWERLMFVEAADSRLRHCILEYSDCVGDHKAYYPSQCGPPPVYAPRTYHEAVVVLASHVDFDACSFTNLPNASATAAGDALAIISDDAQHPGPASANVRNCHFIRIGQGVHTRFAYVLVEGCVFQDKHGDNDDVDLYGESTPPSLIRSNLFLSPSYDDRINPTRCSALIIGNTIYGSSDHGIVLRDVSQPILINNVLYNCGAGGISVQNGCDALLVNNTLVNCNRAIKLFDHLDRTSPPYCLTATSGRATLINNIIWDSTPAFDLSGNAFGILTVDVSYSDIEGGINNATKRANAVLTGGPGNLDADPRFADAANADFHLLPSSPCLDTGTNLSALVSTDFDGIPRPLDGDGNNGPTFDLGAYEFLLDSADSNGDGIPDGWCWRYGLNPADAEVGQGNPDHDAPSTFEEWVADTDPTNAQSFFRLESISLGSAASVSLLTSSNRQYTLFGLDDLSAGSWTDLPGQTSVSGSGGLLTLQDTNPTPARFYRVGVSIP